MSTSVREDLLPSVAYERDTDLSAVKNLAPPKVGKNRATRALVQAEAQNVRWLDTPGNAQPTATFGQPLLAGQSLWVSITELQQFRYVQAVPGAILNITFYA